MKETNDALYQALLIQAQSDRQARGPWPSKSPGRLPARRRLIYRSNMSPTFPSLRLLEAATRHESFTAAAKEVGVTHSAMSSGIRRIETDLGVTLFRRQTHKTYATEAALALAAAYREADSILRAAIGSIQPDSDIARPRIKVDQDLWDLWLESAWNDLFEAGVVPGLYPDVTKATGMFSSGDLHLSFESEAVKGYARRIFATLRLVLVGRIKDDGSSPEQVQIGALGCRIFAPRSAPWRAWIADESDGRMIGKVTELVYHRDCLERAMAGEGLAITYRLFARSLVESGRLKHFPDIGAQSVRRPLFLHRRKASAHAGALSAALSNTVGQAIVMAQEEWW